MARCRKGWKIRKGVTPWKGNIEEEKLTSLARLTPSVAQHSLFDKIPATTCLAENLVLW